MKIDPFRTQAVEIAAAVNDGLISPQQAVAPYLDRIKSHQKLVNSHIHFDSKDVDNQLITLGKRLKEGRPLPLAGVPVLIKDNICVKGEPLTCGSKILGTYAPPFDATVIERLRFAGAILFGKTNLDEFGMGSSNETSAYGPVKNPWNLERVPGGSSGGSAAGVAAGFAPVALGTDTGGSVRQPASFCGLLGVKPSYGRVSRYGVVAYGSSLDQVGPLCRSVMDASLVMDVISGSDSLDSTCIYEPTEAVNLIKTGKNNQQKTKIFGVIKELTTGEGIDSDVQESMESSLESLRQAGHKVVEVSIPAVQHSIACYYLIATAEASSNLSRFDGVRFGKREPTERLEDLYLQSRSKGFGDEVKRRIMLGTFALTSGYVDAYYNQATKVRRLIQLEFADALEQCDALLSPATPTTAFKLGENVEDPLTMYLNDLCTTSANLAEIPAASIPMGLDADGLPIGLQVYGGKGEDELLLETLAIIEELGKKSDDISLGGRVAEL